MIVSRAYDDRRLRLMAELSVGKTVLDIGYAQQPNPHLVGFHRTGLDLNRAKPGPVQYEEEIVGDVTRLTEICAGRRFDTVICAELIEHLENPYALLRDVHSVLADDGRLLVSTPNPLAFPVVVAELLRLKRFFYTRDHLYYFLPRWVERLFEATGFEMDRVVGVGLWTPIASFPYVPISLSYQVIYVGKKAS